MVSFVWCIAACVVVPAAVFVEECTVGAKWVCVVAAGAAWAVVLFDTWVAARTANILRAQPERRVSILLCSSIAVVVVIVEVAVAAGAVEVALVYRKEVCAVDATYASVVGADEIAWTYDGFVVSWAGMMPMSCVMMMMLKTFEKACAMWKTYKQMDAAQVVAVERDCIESEKVGVWSACSAGEVVRVGSTWADVHGMTKLVAADNNRVACASIVERLEDVVAACRAGPGVVAAGAKINTVKIAVSRVEEAAVHDDGA